MHKPLFGELGGVGSRSPLTAFLLLSLGEPSLLPPSSTSWVELRGVWVGVLLEDGRLWREREEVLCLEALR